MPNTEQEQLIEELVEQYRKSLRRHLPREPQTLDEIEQVVEDVSQEVDRHLERAILERRQSLESSENQLRCPRCSGWARYRSVSSRILVTRHGERPFVRRYYHCASCRSGFAPLDQALGLGRQASTATVRQFSAQLAAHLPFGEAAHLLGEMMGVRLGTSTVERLAVEVGKALRAAQRSEAQRHRSGKPPAVERKPARLYVSVDGIMAPLREAWKKDGSAGQLRCRFGECKTAVLYEARSGKRGDEGVLRRAYIASFEKVDAFGLLVSTLAHRCGQHFAKELIFLADGQTYTWLLAATHFPEAVQIVDFMHAVEHLYGVARDCLGEQTPGVEPWVRARKEELMNDRLTAVLSAIETLPAATLEQQATRKREYGYFQTNSERMRYGTFRKRGYQIATGVMEAGCKQVVHQRLDQVGMHWRQPTAEAIVALRAALLSSNPPDLRPYCAAA
jgi:hypothetical protein